MCVKTGLKTLVASVALVAVSSTSALAEGIDYGPVANKVANLLWREHFNRQEINDEVSRELLENYLDFLDLGRYYFLQSDIDYFEEKFQKTLDDSLALSDIKPAYEIYGVYEQRVKDRIEWIKEVLEAEQFTFDSDETIAISRKELPWPADKTEADKVWINIIEGELLQEELRRESIREKEEEEAAEAAENADAEEKTEEVAEEDTEIEKTPREIVADRYGRILESLEENTPEDVAGFFLKSLSHVYDPHSDYFTQSEYENFQIQMRKHLTGIGALLSMDRDSGYARINGLVVGGPAHQGGELKVADQIVAVGEGEKGELVDITHMKLQKVVDLIRGRTGSIVRLKVIPAESVDPSDTNVINIIRDKVDLKDSLARAELIETLDREGNPTRLGWIDLPSFYADMQNGQTSVTRDTHRLLTRLMNEGMDGLILDLRENGGGSLEEAINLTGLFIHRGPVVQAVNSRDEVDSRISSRRQPVYDGPMVVLTSKASASASEILAAALQDYNRAVVIGEQSTFGKGTVQQLLPVTTGGFSILLPGATNQAGALKLTIQKFYRIAGGSTQQKGVVPDIIHPSVTDAMDIGEASFKNPLPYDQIRSQQYALFRENPLPIDQLRVTHQQRIDESPDFQWVKAETQRFKERTERNAVSLNKETRKNEIQMQEERTEARRETLKQRYAEQKEEEEGLFETYSITLDRVGDPELKKLSEVSDEEFSGMMVEGAGEKTEEQEALEPAHGYGYVKREAIEVLLDFMHIEEGKSISNGTLTAAESEDEVPATAN